MSQASALIAIQVDGPKMASPTLASLVSDLAEFSFTRSYAQKRIQIGRRMGGVPSFDGPSTANASVFLDITPTMATGMDEL